MIASGSAEPTEQPNTASSKQVRRLHQLHCVFFIEQSQCARRLKTRSNSPDICLSVLSLNLITLCVSLEAVSLFHVSISLAVRLSSCFSGVCVCNSFANITSNNSIGRCTSDAQLRASSMIDSLNDRRRNSVDEVSFFSKIKSVYEVWCMKFGV